MVKAGKGDLRTLADGLFPSGLDAAALTPEGRDEVRNAVDVILKLWDYQTARAGLALKTLDGAADEIERYRSALRQIAYGAGKSIVPPEDIARKALGLND